LLTVGNSPDRSAKTTIYSRAGVPQGHFFVLRTQGTCSRRNQATRRAAFPEGKACEARPVGETASRVWRRGQNIQGICRRIFWAPQEYRGTAACGGGRGITKNPEGNTPFVKWERDTKWRGDSSNEPGGFAVL